MNRRDAIKTAAAISAVPMLPVPAAMAEAAQLERLRVLAMFQITFGGGDE